MRRLLTFVRDLLLLFVTHLPGPTGYGLRRRYWKKRLRHLGANALIDTGVHLQNPEFISIGRDTWIDKNVVILAGVDASHREKLTLENPGYTGEPGVVHIGNNVHVGIGCIISGIAGGVQISDDCGLAAHVQVYAFTHHHRSRADPAKRAHFGPMGAADRQCLVVGPVSIGENTGIAARSVILPGTALPRDCFVGVDSVVLPGRHAENSVLTGNPARRVRDRFVANR
jgi:acetyltransferase-like isoleucine patch superfamily enzyme